MSQRTEGGMQAGWSGWRRVAGCIYEGGIPIRMKVRLQEGSCISSAVWLGGDGTDKETSGGAGGGIVQDVAIFVGGELD